MGETEAHIRAIMHLFLALDLYLAGRADWYVGADLLLYYEEGDPTQVVVPDVFVAEGVAKGTRRTYRLWEEKAAPKVIFEVTSKSSRLEDLGSKKALYEQLGVAEYYVFDPLDEYLRPRLQGFRLEGGVLAPTAPSAGGTFDSPALGLELVPEGELLRLRDRETGALLPSLREEAHRADQEARGREEAERRAAEEARGRREAEAELARVRAELERLRRGG